MAPVANGLFRYTRQTLIVFKFSDMVAFDGLSFTTCVIGRGKLHVFLRRSE
jgi:ribonuclease HII